MIRLFLCVLLAGCCQFASLGEDAASPSGSTHPATALLNKASGAFSQGKAKESLALFVSAHQQHSDLPPGEIMFARLAFRSTQVQAGRNALELASINHSDDPELWNLFADLATRDGRLAESIVLFQHALEAAEQFNGDEIRKRKQTIAAHAGLGQLLQRRKQWDQAKTHLRSWIDLDQRNVAAWQRLATVFFQMERYETAEQTLINLSKFSPDQPAAELTMGQMYQATGKFELAKESMLAAIRQNEDDLGTRVAVARWALASGERELLRSSVEKAKQLAPDSPAVDALQGMMERFAGDLLKAETIFAELYKNNPASFDATNGLALTLLSQDDEDKHARALQYAEVLVKSNPDRSTAKGRVAAATYAWALHRNGKNEEANQAIRLAVSGGEVSPEIGYFAAAIFEAVGEREAARVLVKAAIESPIAFPEQKQAEELLQRLGD